MTGVSVCVNALDHTVLASSSGNFTFGRTVIVTGCYVRIVAAPGSVTIVEMQHLASRLAAATTIGSIITSTSVTGMAVGYTWKAMTVAAGKTFTSDEVLGFTVATVMASGGGTFDFMVRYKEK